MTNWIIAIVVSILAAFTPVHHFRAVRGHLSLSVTAYCATGNLTASGLVPRVGMAAGNHWPFGTRIFVPGYGVVTIEDRIGHDSDLDLFMASCSQTVQWGRRQLNVRVLR